MLSFNIKQLIKQSLFYTWKNKLLWVFGIFIASGALLFNYVMEDWNGLALFREQFVARSSVIFSDFGLFFVMLLSVLFVCVFLLLSIFSKICLLNGLGQLHKGEKFQFKKALITGKKKFGKLFLVELLLGIVNCVIFLAILLFFNVKVLVTLLVIVILFYNLLLFLFRHYIYCFLVLEEQKPVQSIVSGWQFFVANLGSIIRIKLIELCLWVVAFFVLMISIVLLFLPFVLLAIIGFFVFGLGALAVISITAYFVLILTFIFIKGGLQTFFFSYLTNVYWALKK